MLLDPAAFAFTRGLEASHRAIHDEFGALRRDDFLGWPDRRACGGTWLVAPLASATASPSIRASCSCIPSPARRWRDRGRQVGSRTSTLRL